MSKILDLETRIMAARDAYYNTDVPIMSDKAFDALIDELKTLDPNNKAVIMVGAPIKVTEWKKAKHQIPMGSLDKVNTPAELSAWVDTLPLNGKLLIAEKLDGLSIEVIYENGAFLQAITRGTDGIEGEDITVNVAKMGGVPAQLKDNFTGSLRGEIIMKKSVHQKHFSDKANPRNAASGVAKRLDGVGVEYLNIFFYQALGDIEFGAEQAQFAWLVDQGLTTPLWCLAKTDDEVNKFWRDYQDTKRDKLDYDIDGLVIRVDNLDDQAALGDKDLRPKGAKAFKFDNETRESVIRDITWQVGNSGRITPVATVDPVMLVGATVTRASIYNLTYIEELSLDVGATVLVARANDVIPRIEELIKGTGTVAKPPSHCPACNSPTIMNGENLQCTNPDTCPAQIIGRIKNWVAELNLLEWGDTLIEKLVLSGKVNDVSDLYTLTVDDIANLDRMGDKSAKKCYEILWANAEIPLETFLGALSIEMIGSSSIKIIMNHGCDTLEKFGQLSAADFELAPGIGPTKAKNLANGLKNNQQLIINLLNNGIQIKEQAIGKLSGKSFAITGTLSIKRNEIEKMIKDNGGEVKSSVNKGLSYLIISDPQSTSSKAQTARKLGSKLINETEFFNLIK